MFTVKRRVKKDTDAYSSIRVYISSVEIYKLYILGSMKLFVSAHLSQKYLIFSELLSFLVLNVPNKNCILKKFSISLSLSLSF